MLLKMKIDNLQMNGNSIIKWSKSQNNNKVIDQHQASQNFSNMSFKLSVLKLKETQEIIQKQNVKRMNDAVYKALQQPYTSIHKFFKQKQTYVPAPRHQVTQFTYKRYIRNFNKLSRFPPSNAYLNEEQKEYCERYITNELENREWISLRYCMFNVQKFVRMRNWDNTLYLVIESCMINNAKFRVFIRMSKWFPKLKYLHLHDNPITAITSQDFQYLKKFQKLILVRIGKQIYDILGENHNLQEQTQIFLTTQYEMNIKPLIAFGKNCIKKVKTQKQELDQLIQDIKRSVQNQKRELQQQNQIKKPLKQQIQDQIKSQSAQKQLQ